MWLRQKCSRLPTSFLNPSLSPSDKQPNEPHQYLRDICRFSDLDHFWKHLGCCTYTTQQIYDTGLVIFENSDILHLTPMLTHAEQMTFFNFHPCSSESLCTPLENKLLSDKNLHLHISLLCSCMLQIGCQRYKKQNSNTCQYDWKWDCFCWCFAPAL